MHVLTGRQDQPAWLQAAMRELNEKYPDDKLEAVLRRGPNPAQPEWRIKCTDCPGKVRPVSQVN